MAPLFCRQNEREFLEELSSNRGGLHPPILGNTPYALPQPVHSQILHSPPSLRAQGVPTLLGLVPHSFVTLNRLFVFLVLSQQLLRQYLIVRFLDGSATAHVPSQMDNALPPSIITHFSFNSVNYPFLDTSNAPLATFYFSMLVILHVLLSHNNRHGLWWPQYAKHG